MEVKLFGQGELEAEAECARPVLPTQRYPDELTSIKRLVSEDTKTGARTRTALCPRSVRLLWSLVMDNGADHSTRFSQSSLQYG